MNPTEETKAPPVEVVSKEMVAKIVSELEEQSLTGLGKYEDEDSEALLGISLGALRLARQMVKQFLGTPFVPKWVANSPNPAGTFLATVVRGHELGFKMMEALGCLYLGPDGRMGMYGTAMIALMRKSGVKLKFKDLKDEKNEPWGCEVWGKREGEDGDEYTSTFTRADALRAGITGMHGKYPQWMCKWRAVSDLFRSLCPDLSGGPVYSLEELQEDEKFHVTDTPRLPAPAPEPEHDPYAVQMPAKTESAAPIVESAANKAEADGAPKAGADTSSSASGSPGGPGDASVTDAPPQAGGESPSASQNGAVGATAAPQKIQEMPKAKADGGPTLADIEKMLPAKTRKKTIDEFLRGYFRKADMKAIIADPGLPDALRCLAANATTEWKVKLEADPHGVGVKCANGWKKLKAYAWSPETRGYLETLALKLYPDAGGGLLADILTLVKADQMPAEELTAFLWVLERVPDTAAVKFWKRVKSMAETAEVWQSKSIPEGEIIDRIEALPEPTEQEQGSLLPEGA